MLKLILFNRCSQQKMDRLAYDDLGRRSCEICLDAILFFVIEVERHHLEQACEHIVQGYRMAVVIVHRRDQSKRMTDHDDVLGTIVRWIFKADNTELPMPG